MHLPRSLRTATLLSSTLLAGIVTVLPLANPTASAAAKHPVAAIREIDVTATEYALNLHLKGPVATGRVEVVLRNAGSMPHQAALLRLHPGVTAAQFKAIVASAGDGAGLALADPMGGAGTISPGGRQVSWQLLKAGNYLAACFVQGPDGKSHLDLGMLASFTVAGAQPKPGHVGAGLFAVKPQHTITAHDMRFTLPKAFTGKGVYRFTDTDAEDVHEIAFLKLAPGKHKADVLSWFAHPGMPPFSFAGGLSPVVPHGGTALMQLNLAPGTYVATCFIPDEMAPHLPHALLGMMVEFTIH